MIFSGTLIEDLIATVERVEQAAQSNDTLVGRFAIAEDLLVSVEQDTNYDSNVLVA
jgi:hypothetical protein